MPSSSIEALVQEELSAGSQSKRGPYSFYSPKDKAKIANYAVLHGTSSAVKHFIKEFLSLKRTTVNDWKFSVIKLGQKNHNEGLLLNEMPKKEAEPLLCRLIYLTRAGSTINSAIVLAAATGITPIHIFYEMVRFP